MSDVNYDYYWGNTSHATLKVFLILHVLCIFTFFIVE